MSFDFNLYKEMVLGVRGGFCGRTDRFFLYKCTILYNHNIDLLLIQCKFLSFFFFSFTNRSC